MTTRVLFLAFALVLIFSTAPEAGMQMRATSAQTDSPTPRTIWSCT